uniref:Uncharacterized protein n=2 Tax=unclassified Mycobacterium TaxID=2642494 RepID=A0A5Q5BTP4_MYCSS
MGFFSSACEGCGHPLLSVAATEDINRWMNLGVAITPGGSILQGSYDGYGNLDAFEAVVGDATVWHQACWKVAGAPMDYRGASAPAPDQGWFFEDGAHDLAEPGRAAG